MPEKALPVPAGTKWRRYWYLPVFAAYAAVVGATVAHHKPWLDEAQAWLIARDAAWPDMLSTLPRYEGSPMLWHVILALPARCGLPYACLGAIGAAIASGGTLLFLARSPLPKLLTAMVPFTFFLIYQYAVIARSYVLMPLLLFLCADLYPERLRRPILYVAPLCLLAQLSAHGLFIAAALAGVLGVEALAVSYRTRDPAVLMRAAAAVGLFGLAAAAAVWEAFPPSDHYGGLGFQHPDILFIVERWSGAFTDSYVPSLLVFAVSLAWFRRTGVLALYVVPTAAVLTLFVVAACWYHHEGVLFLVWLFAVWVSFRRYRSMGSVESQQAARLRRIFSALAACVFALHIYWACASIRNDLRYDYSGAKAVADYLKREGLDAKRIAVNDIYATAIAPYFDKNIFANFRNGRGTSFVVWAAKYFDKPDSFGFCLPYSRFRMPYREPFDVLILGVKYPPFSSLPWDDPAFDLPLSSEFRCAGHFPGNLFWKTAVYERDDFVCYVRKDLPAARHEQSSRAAPRPDLPVLNLERIAWVREIAAQAVIARSKEGIAPPAKEEPDNPLAVAHGVFARMLLSVDPQAAAEHCRAAVQIEPSSLMYCDLGRTLAETNPAEAVQHLKTALELNPRNSAAYATLGNIYTRSGQYDVAIECYRSALANVPELSGAADHPPAIDRQLLPDYRPTSGSGAPGAGP
jgi:hypothetical protein